MEFTLNCNRVPIPEGTLFEGVPIDIGPAPVLPGLESNRTSPAEAHDGVAPNPAGKAAPDGKDNRPKQLFRCKNYTILSTLNTRTLQPKGRLEELAHCAKTNSIDVVAIQEHRFHHPDVPYQYHNAGSYQLITSSATKNGAGATIGGVGFLISPRASENLARVEPISSRILVLELEGNPKTTIICAYSPHNSSSIEDMNEFLTICVLCYQTFPNITSLPCLVTSTPKWAQISRNSPSTNQLIGTVNYFQTSLMNITSFVQTAAL